MNNEIWVLLFVLIPGVLMDMKEKKIVKEYWLTLSVATYIFVILEQAFYGIQAQVVYRCIFYVILNRIISKYGHKMEKMIGKSDLYCLNIFCLVLKFKYLIIVISLSLLLTIIIGLIMIFNKKIREISRPQKRLHFEVPYLPMLYISYAIVNIESLLMRMR